MFWLFICLTYCQLTIGQEFLQSDFTLADNYMRQSEYEKATQIYERLFAKSPFNTTYLQRLISCYQQTDKFKKAEIVIKKQLQKNKKLPYLHVLLGYNYDKQQLKTEAEHQYKKAIAIIKEKPNYAGTVGRIFKDYALLDYAIETYTIAMQKNKNVNFNFQIAQIYGEKGEFEKMFKAYVDLVDKRKDYLTLTQRFTSKYISDDPEDEANIFFKKALLQKAISKPKNEWNILLSWLFSQQKQYNKALLQEKAIYNRNPTDESNIFSLGKTAFNNKSYDAAKNCFDFVLEKSTDNDAKIEAHLYRLKTAIAANAPNIDKQFQDVFLQFGKNRRTIPIQIEYADYLTFKKGNPLQAKKVLEEALQYTPSKYTKARIQLKLGDILVFTNQYNTALIYFSKIQSQLKGSEIAQQARFKIAQTSYFKGDFSWAKAQLKVLKSSTSQKIANDAVDLFLKISDNEPVDSIPTGLKQLAKAELFAYQNKTDDALTIINELFTDTSLFANGLTASEIIYDDALFLQAKLFIKQKKYDDAILSFAKIVAADAQGFLTDDVYFLMAELYHYQLNNIEKAKEYYQKIIFDYPSSIYLVEARKRFRKLRGDKV